MAVHKVTKELEQIYYTCDICTKELPCQKRCVGCKRDVCTYCSSYQNNPFNCYNDEIQLCKTCKLFLKNYKEEVEVLIEEHEAKMETLENSWRKDCLDAIR